MSAIAGYTGRLFFGSVEAFFAFAVLAVDTLFWAAVAPVRGKGFRVRYSIEQFVEYGYRSLPVVMLICFLIGVTIALQSAVQLDQFGVVHLVANLVGVGAMRELAPLMTAIIITGRSGSAITAEIGTMKVAEELDALEVMGLNPTKFLVAPKFVAMILAVPMVTIIAVATMILGGAFVAITIIGMDAQLYLTQTVEALVLKDFVVGMTKSFFFAIVICWVGVYRGFQVEGGAEGVGKRTTSSVVTSIFLIIFVDTLFTILFNSNIL
jgi:phospholipid/cholesterol/gamma-HCH transport system permease protein